MAERSLLVCFNALEAVELAGFVAQLGSPFDILAFGEQPPVDLGADEVMVVDLDPGLPADALTTAILDFCASYTHVAARSSMRAKDVMARVAGGLSGAMVTDVVAIESTKVFHRPIVAGTLLAAIEILEFPVVLTVRTAAFPKSSRGGTSRVMTISSKAVSQVRQVPVAADPVSRKTRPELSQARIVVSGGRPLRDAETFERVIGGLADALGGAVGATRAAVDAGIAPSELQVGQTGQIVAPDLYIAAGISGSTQHMAGIKDSKLIVAINSDPDAPIFQIADLGLVTDLFDALPRLQALVETRSSPPAQ